MGLASGVIAQLLAVDAWGFCREVTAPTPAGYDPAISGCYYPAADPRTGGGVFDLYWRNLCVGYSIASAASDQVTLDQATRLAAQAFAAWTGASCAGGGPPSINALNEGPVACDAVRYNAVGGNQHVIAFRDSGWPYDDSSNTLGLTTLTVNTATGEIYDADMEINSHDFMLSVDGMIHEAGHFLGLAHSDDPTAVMFARYVPLAGPLAPDDVAGICAVDPPNATRTTSVGTLAASACDPSPRNGFSPTCDGSGVASDGGVVTATLACGTNNGCAAVPGGSSGRSGAWGLLAMAGLVGLVRRRRLLRWAAGRSAVLLVGASLVTGAAVVAPREAKASVSIAVLLDDLVKASSGVATITALEQRSAWEDGRVYTYTRVRVDATVAGHLPAETIIRTLGGAVGVVAQLVEGEAAFVVGQRSLVFLRPRVDRTTGVPTGDFVVSARAQGQFAIAAGADGTPRLVATPAGLLLPGARFRGSSPAAPGGVASAPVGARALLDHRPLVEATQAIAAAWALQRADR
jgi:MYXO-CTERM domain-containing protein